MKLLLRLLFFLGTAILLTDVLGALPRRYVPPPLRHPAGGAAARFIIVRQGDTLYAIARRHVVPLDALRAVNSLKSDVIWAGQRLRLPDK